MVCNLEEIVNNCGEEVTYETLAEQTIRKLPLDDVLAFAIQHLKHSYWTNYSIALNDFALYTDNDFEDKVESKLRERTWV